MAAELSPTSFSPSFHLQRCEPGVAHGANDPQIQFADDFRRMHLPVDGKTGIGFEEYQKMQTRKRKGVVRPDTPEWALDNHKMQKLIVAFIEKRAYSLKERRALEANPPKASPIQRVNEATRVLVSRQEKKVLATMRRLCEEYVALKKSENPDRERLRVLEVQIRNTNTTLRFNRNAAAFIAAIGFLAYRCGLDSVAVGAEIGFTPLHVRALMCRLNRCWKELQNQQLPKVQETKPPKPAPVPKFCVIEGCGKPVGFGRSRYCSEEHNTLAELLRNQRTLVPRRKK